MEDLIRNWQQRNIVGYFLQNRDQVHEKLLQLIPQTATVGFSGSATLDSFEVIELLESRSNKVFNQYNPDLSREESMDMRMKGAQADFYLCSANAIARTGELVFLSAFGHRISGIASARKVIVIAGINKVSEGVYTALKRAREVATPKNCKHLNWDTPCKEDGICRSDICLYPEYRRMCCQLLVLEAEVAPGRLSVILVNENLGF